VIALTYGGPLFLKEMRKESFKKWRKICHTDPRRLMQTDEPTNRNWNFGVQLSRTNNFSTKGQQSRTGRALGREINHARWTSHASWPRTTIISIPLRQWRRYTRLFFHGLAERANTEENRTIRRQLSRPKFPSLPTGVTSSEPWAWWEKSKWNVQKKRENEGLATREMAGIQLGQKQCTSFVNGMSGSRTILQNPI
jgi:hypothetical protein